MSNPLVSIVICTYNRADMLKEALPSILAQRYEPFEVLIVDDGSTDGTRDVVSEYGDRIRYYWQDNKGLAAARSIACGQLAKGEYIAFQDDDDIMAPNRITCLYAALCSYPQAVLAVGDWEMIGAEGRLLGERITFDIRGKNGKPLLIHDGYKAVLWPLLSPLPNATIFRKVDGDRIGWLDTRFSRGSDTDFFARLGQLGPIVYTPQVVAYYRTGHVRMWSDDISNNLVCEYSNFQLYEKHLKMINGHQGELRRRLQERMLNTLKRMFFLTRYSPIMPESVDKNYLEKGLALVGVKEKLAYKWYTDVRLPLRNLIKGQ